MLLIPRGLDRLGALLADARDFVQAAGVFVDDLQRVGAEVVDDFLSVGFADAVDQAAAQIFANAVNRGGQLGFEGADFKLVAVRGVPRPLAAELEGLAALHAGQGAQDGDWAFFLSHADFSHAIGIFLVEKDDSLEDACDGLVVLGAVCHVRDF